MGEARRRRETDLLYGKVPKVLPSRGIVLSPPIIVDGPRNIELKTSTLDPIETRYSLLFWDKIAWPVNYIFRTEVNNDLQFLVEAGVLIRPTVNMQLNGGIGEMYVASQVRAYEDLEQANPGCWAMAQGERTLQVIGRDSPSCRELLVTLTHAVPIPAGDVPFTEILEFKAKRAAELFSFRTEIEGLYQTVAGGADPSLALRQAKDRIEACCSDLVRVNKEWKFGSLLSDLNFSFSISAAQLAQAVSVAFASSHFGLDHLTSSLMGAASTLSSSIQVGRNLSVGKASPYRYVARAHKELRF
ncbi:DUF6236 family protein [Achromobacter insolitus]|uniref:DUF6236 family protein n=1 Tax=Achromobacter insolitus TaxID=217204 RepID=UPI0028ACD6BA|nr:DUF6236 family protein [Achromobacter insolitus]